MFSQITSSITKAANVAAEKAKETYAHMKALPTEVGCPNCKKVVQVPPEIFLWACSRCQTSNAFESANCSKCNAQKPEGLKYGVTCAICKVVIEVPTSNAVKAVKSAATTTVSAAKHAKEAAVKEYEFLKSVPSTFHCANCNAELHNPNNATPEGAPSSSAEPSAPPASSDPSAPPAVAPVEQKQVDQVMCPICKKITAVPTTNFRDTVTKASASISRGAAKAFYVVSGKKYADCPSCKTPVELPVPPPAPQAQGQPPQAQGESQQPQPQANAVQQHVEASCKKCGAVFPAVV